MASAALWALLSGVSALEREERERAEKKAGVVRVECAQCKHGGVVEESWWCKKCRGWVCGFCIDANRHRRPGHEASRFSESKWVTGVHETLATQAAERKESLAAFFAVVGKRLVKEQEGPGLAGLLAEAYPVKKSNTTTGTKTAPMKSKAAESAATSLLRGMGKPEAEVVVAREMEGVVLETLYDIGVDEVVTMLSVLINHRKDPRNN